MIIEKVCNQDLIFKVYRFNSLIYFHYFDITLVIWLPAFFDPKSFGYLFSVEPSRVLDLVFFDTSIDNVHEKRVKW